MGRKDNGMLLSQSLDKVSYIKYLLGVKTYCRLVKNKYLGVSDKRLSHAHTLLVAL